MRKPKHYFNKTFRQDYLFFIGWSKKTYLKYCKDFLNVSDDRSTSFGEAFMCDDESNTIVIWIYNSKRLDLLSHECVHAANLTLDYIGAIPSFKDDEVQAYLVQELFRECEGKK